MGNHIGNTSLICACCKLEGSFECDVCNGSTFFEAKGPEDFGKEYENVSIMLPRKKNGKDYVLKMLKDKLEKRRIEELKEELRERLRRGLT